MKIRIKNIRNRVIKSRNGFTVVEALIAIAIFGMLMIGMLAAFSGAFAATLKAGRVDKSAASAAGELAQAISDAGYTSENITTAPATIYITMPSGEVVTLTVDKITGTAVTGDGLVVEFISYSQGSGN